MRSSCLLALIVAVAACGGGSSRAVVRSCHAVVPGDLAAAGPYRVESRHIGLTRPATTSSQVRRFDPTAWFPARAGRCRFPLILFSHGAYGAPAKDRPLLAHLASEGFVVLAPHHPDRIAKGDETLERIDDMTYLLDHLRAVARRIAPALPAEIDARRVGIAGQSYGAFVAAYEAVDEPRIRAALVMAGPLETGPAGLTRAPVLAMTGSADTTVPPRLVFAYYHALPAKLPRGILQIASATHSAYGTGCAAQRTCGIVASYATSFFLTYLAGTRNADRLLDPATRRPARLRLQTVRMP